MLFSLYKYSLQEYRTSNLADISLFKIKNGNNRTICEFLVLHDSVCFVLYPLIYFNPACFCHSNFFLLASYFQSVASLSVTPSRLFTVRSIRDCLLWFVSILLTFAILVLFFLCFSKIKNSWKVINPDCYISVVFRKKYCGEDQTPFVSRSQIRFNICFTKSLPSWAIVKLLEKKICPKTFWHIGARKEQLKEIERSTQAFWRIAINEKRRKIPLKMSVEEFNLQLYQELATSLNSILSFPQSKLPFVEHWCIFSQKKQISSKVVIQSISHVARKLIFSELVNVFFSFASMVS